MLKRVYGQHTIQAAVLERGFEYQGKQYGSLSLIGPTCDGNTLEWLCLFRFAERARSMSEAMVRCAVYTRKSTEEGLEQTFNTLQVQRESAEAYILSRKGEEWQELSTLYDDGGFSGASLERPALQQLLADIDARAAGEVSNQRRV